MLCHSATRNANMKTVIKGTPWENPVICGQFDSHFAFSKSMDVGGALVLFFLLHSKCKPWYKVVYIYSLI